MQATRSAELFQQAKKYIPGGVNSPAHALGTDDEELFIDHSRESHVWDIDGKEYIDYVGAWGPLILGHAHPLMVDAVEKAAARGMVFGAVTESEIELAGMIVSAVPSIDMVRLVNSSTEAVASAIRLARGFTGRDKVVLFEGGYHGYPDPLMIKLGSGIPDSEGIPASVTSDTMMLPYNNIDAIRILFETMGNEIACLLVEPVAANMGVVIPEPNYLADLRELTHKYGVVLIFDESITGFRLEYGGAQELYEVIPEMTILGNNISGGIPIGAYGGKQEIMEKIVPQGPVYQAGMSSGNPLAVAAGIETLRILSDLNPYVEMAAKTMELADALAESAENNGVDLEINQIGSMFTPFFTQESVIDYSTAKSSNTQQYTTFMQSMLDQGIYLPTSQFEPALISAVHTDADIEQTIRAAETALEI